MTLELLANAFVCSHDDPARHRGILERMRTCGAFTSVRVMDGWCVGETAFTDGPEQPDTAVEIGMLFVQAPPPLLRSRPSIIDLRDRLMRNPASLGVVDGDVGAVAVEPGAAHLMRPAAGRVPWYWWSDGVAHAAGTRLAYFYHLLGLEDTDSFVHARWGTGYVLPAGRAPLAGVNILKPGHVISLARDVASRAVRYWNPFAVECRQANAETTTELAAGLRQCLVEALERELLPGRGNMLAFSGGVDSSSVAALAVRAANRRIATFSLMPPMDDARWTPEAHFIDALTQDLGIATSVKVPLADQGWVDTHWNAPCVGMAVPHPSLGLLRGFVDDGQCAVLTGGELADLILGGEYLLKRDWLASFSALQIVERLRRPGILNRPRRQVAQSWLETRWRRWLGRAAIPAPAQLPDYVLPALREEYEDWVADTARRISRVTHPYPYTQAGLEDDGWLLMNWEACSALGVRRSAPFATRAVIELALRCHPQEHAEPSKRLLRIGLRDDVPALQLQRPDKGGWDSGPDIEIPWQRPIPQRLERLIRADWVAHPPAEMLSEDVTSLAGLILGTEPPQLVPAGGVRQSA